MHDLHQTAVDQHGLVARRQLRDLGYTRQQIQRWTRDGRLLPVHDNVFALPGSVPTPKRDVLAAILETGADAWASHTTAAWVWDLRGFASHPIHVVVNRHSRHHERLPWIVHQFTGRPAPHRRVMDGIPVSSPALTMLHLAQIVSKARLGQAIDNAWSERLLSGKDLFAIDDELAQRGRNGIVALREAAEARGINYAPPESNLESRFMMLMDPIGQRGFRRQVRIAGRTWSARVDFLHEPSRTVIEIQSERYHASLTDRTADAERIALLERAGYRVVEIWDNELFQNPAEVMARVNRAIYRVA